MRTLYVIGNGFDLHHKIPSRYSDFKSFCEGKCCDFLLERYLPDLNPDTWSNFEKSLGKQRIEYLLDGLKRNKSIQKDYDLGIDKQQLDMIFGDWIIDLNKNITKTKYHQLCEFVPDSIFVSFNYTDTLEEIYEIAPNRILHLHGYIEPGTTEEHYFRGYIYGHGLDKLDILRSISETLVPDECDRYDIMTEISYFGKRYQVSLLRDWLRIFDIDKIIVRGHSMDEIDAPYYRILLERYPSAAWKIGFYDEEDEKNKRVQCNVLNIPKPDFEKF